MPRRILPGAYYLLTRRCTQRQFLLRPDPTMNAIFAYCLAEAARRFEVGLIAWVAMSNHYHAVVYDPMGRVPAFIEHFHKMVAKTVNARFKRWENVWSSDETCVTALATPADMFDKVVYVLTNPVAAHLVESADSWPGCTSLRHLDAIETVHERPTFFFRPDGAMPRAVTLRAIQPPTSKKRESRAAWAARVRDAVHARERILRAERSRKNLRVLPRHKLLRTSPFAAPPKEARHRKLRPAIACKDEMKRIALLDQLVAFRIAHEEARLQFIHGKHKITFPAGTYRLRAWGARCAPFPPPESLAA